MDLLKIFRMQEPVPKDLLTKNNEIGKYKEVVQEKEILLRNSRARIRELEQQVKDLESKNNKLEGQINSSESHNIIREYEAFFSKIMSDSEDVIQERNFLENKYNEMETFSKNILEKYEKSKEVINEYENVHEKLKHQILEYEEIINSLTEEYNRIKDYFQPKVSEGFYLGKDCKNNIQQKGKIREQLLKKQCHFKELQKNFIKNHCSNSMFEPLKGLDK